VATFGNIIDTARAITLDANRNIGGINFAGNSSAYNLSGGSILLTNGGTIQTSGGGSAHTDTIASPIEIQGDGGTASFTAGSSTSTRLLSITGAVTGVSTGTNVTTLTLGGGNSGNNEISGLISDGSGGGKLAIVKSGAGVWRLSNAGNNFTGGITISGGKLRSNATGLGEPSNVVTFSGTTGILAGLAKPTLPQVVSVPEGVKGTLETDFNNNANTSGPITGSGTLQITSVAGSAGSISLSSTASTFSGILELNAPANLTVTMNSLSDSTNSIRFLGANSTTFDLSLTAPLASRRIELAGSGSAVFSNNSSGTTNIITIGSDLLVSAAGNKTFTLGGSNTGANAFNGVIANSTTPAATISLTKSGAGRWILGNGNTYTGTTTIAGGVLVANHANALPGGTGTSGGTSALTLAGGVLGLGVADFTRPLGAAGSAEAVNFGTGGGGWAAYGADRLVNPGGAGAPIDWASADTGFNGQTLILGAAGATHKVTLINDLNLGTATRTVNVGNGPAAIDAELSGVISGDAGGALTKSGAGLLSLTNANTYSGATTVSAGVLKSDNAEALPGGPGGSGTSNLVIGGGVIGLTAASGNFNRALGTGANQARWTAGGGFAAYGGTRSVFFSASSINWASSNFITGGGTLILSNATADGTLIWQQPISMAGSTRTVQVDNGSASVDATMSGNIAGGSSGTSNGFTKTGAGTLAFTANGNSYWGPTTINAGTLTVGNGGTGGILSVNSASTVVASGATLAVNRTNDVSQNGGGGLGNGSALISGAGNFAQIGTGTTTLSLSNTYTGTTTVSAGTLVISGATQATSAITVASGATLGLDLAKPITAANAAVTLGGKLLVTGEPTEPSYTLLTAASITGAPVLATPIEGYTLVVDGNALKLNSGGAPTGFAAWQAANGTAGGLGDDHDNDGVDNGTEYFIYGPVASSGFTALPSVVNTGGTLSVTWTKAAGYTGAYGVAPTGHFVVETSATLTGAWAPEASPGTVTISGNDVTYTFPNPLGTKKFARLKVTGP
jgi:autotransporter-associated beta strand protein